MHAARGGHLKSIEFLKNRGCDLDIKTRLGQTATEIALFWQQPEVVTMLTSGQPYVYKPSIFFTHNPLDRSAHHRSNDTWLWHAQRHPNSKFILMHHSKPVVSTDSNSRRSKLLTLNCFEADPFIDRQVQNLIFLGVDEPHVAEPLTDLSPQDSNPRPIGPVPFFAVGINDEQLAEVSKMESNAHVLAMFPNALQLSQSEAAIAGQARSLADWHHRLG